MDKGVCVEMCGNVFVGAASVHLRRPVPPLRYSPAEVQQVLSTVPVGARVISLDRTLNGRSYKVRRKRRWVEGFEHDH